MMERLLADVKEAGYETLVLWVLEKNTSAIRFYESFGFARAEKSAPPSARSKKCTARRCDAHEKSRPGAAFPFYFFSA